MNEFTYTSAKSMMQLTTNFKKYFMKEVAMTGLFLFFVLTVIFLVVPSFLELNAESNEEHIINASWLDSEDKFHFISRWGA